MKSTALTAHRPTSLRFAGGSTLVTVQGPGGRGPDVSRCALSITSLIAAEVTLDVTPSSRCYHRDQRSLFSVT